MTTKYDVEIDDDAPEPLQNWRYQCAWVHESDTAGNATIWFDDSRSCFVAPPALTRLGTSETEHSTRVVKAVDAAYTEARYGQGSDADTKVWVFESEHGEAMFQYPYVEKARDAFDMSLDGIRRNAELLPDTDSDSLIQVLWLPVGNGWHYGILPFLPDA